MRLVSIHAHAIDFEFLSGGFSASYGRRSRLANVLLVLGAADGASGFGEVCQFSGVTPAPLEPVELARIADCCQGLIGLDSREIGVALGALGANAPDNLRCAIDTALWDMMGRRTGQPVFRLFGGRAAERMAAYASLSSETPEAMVRAAEVARQRGINRFQMKIEGNPDLDIPRIRAVAGSMREGERALADANGGLDPEGAMVISKALDDIDVLLEEPCRTFEENLEVARRSGHGVVLDQCLSSPMMYVRALGAGVFAGAGIKPSNLGGLTPARTVRDLCIAAGLPMKIDDSWAADVGTLGSMHVAAGVPADLLIATVDMRGYFDGAMFSGGPRDGGGELDLGDAPGLGLTPLPNSFGAPVLVVDDAGARPG